MSTSTYYTHEYYLFLSAWVYSGTQLKGPLASFFSELSTISASLHQQVAHVSSSNLSVEAPEKKASKWAFELRLNYDPHKFKLCSDLL